MKYTINHTCGHIEIYDIGGKGKDREWRIAYLESCECPECKKAKARQGKILVSIRYREWKKNWVEKNAARAFKTKEYNKETKCMDIYMTTEEKEQFDFYPLYQELQERIGQEKYTFDEVSALYNHYSQEYNTTDAKELIDHLYELVKEAGILITDEEIEQENN